MQRARFLRTWGAAVLVLAFGQGVAIAQQPVDPAAGATTGAAGTQAGAGAQVGVGLQRQVTLSPQDQLTQADSDLARMESSRTTVRRQLMEAREKRDVVKTLCLNDKLTQLNVAVSSAEERRGALSAAVKANDVDAASHEFNICSVLRQRSDQLMTEANQCIGEETGFVGQSSVTSTVEDLPEEDPSEYPQFGILVEPPSCASCFN